MSAADPKRYFVNKLCDYSGEPVVVDTNDYLLKKTLEFIHQVYDSQSDSHSECEGGLYVGVAGLAYMLYYMGYHPLFIGRRYMFMAKSEDFIVYALNYIEKAHIRCNKTRESSFMLASAGVYVMAAVIVNVHGKRLDCAHYLQKFLSFADVCLEKDFLSCGSDELFVGRAGILCGTLFLHKIFKREIVPEEKVFALCNTIVESGTEYSQKVNSPCPLMFSYYETEYLGAAHGLSSILQMLISFPKYLEKHPEAAKKIRDSVDYLLSLQTNAGNFPAAMDEVENPKSEANELVHWCHGAPGVFYLMAKAYLLWKDEKYLQSCLKCGEITWQKGLLKKGPGICHGIAGSGYVFLNLYRLTKDEKHLHRAVQFAHFLFSDEFKTARLPDRPVSLFEGLAGTVCFLGDVLQPDKATFPFFDIF